MGLRPQNHNHDDDDAYVFKFKYWPVAELAQVCGIRGCVCGIRGWTCGNIWSALHTATYIFFNAGWSYAVHLCRAALHTATYIFFQLGLKLRCTLV
jgi:hypothetical protein